MPGTVDVRVGSLEDIREDWIAAWDADASATPFHRPEFLLAWWNEMAPAAQPVVVRAGDGIVLATLADGTLQLLGDPEITDYLGPLGSDRDAVAAAFVEAARGLDDWRTADLPCLDEGTGWADALGRAFGTAGLMVQAGPMDVCPRIDTSAGHAAYLGALPGKLRHEIGRKARRLEREAGGFSIRLSTPVTLDADLDRFFEMHRSSEGQKGKFLHEGMAGFFTAIARGFDQLGWLRLSWLEIGGESLAGILSFSVRGTWYVYNSAYDHRRRELGPGMVLMGETIRLAAEEGCSTVDLLRGDEPYKYRFGATPAPILRLTAHRP